MNHPTFFPRSRFGDLCRGCEFELGEEIDWGAVDTIEILTGPAAVDPVKLGLPGPPGPVQNPFMETAIALWDRLLGAGHRITAVSGSDDKLGPGLGSSATAVRAGELSRPALTRAIRAGHAYVRTRGVHGSPSLALRAVAPDGARGIFGDAFAAKAVSVTVRVRRGRGQVLTVVRDGVPVARRRIPSNDFTHRFTARRHPGSGPLGTAARPDGGRAVPHHGREPDLPPSGPAPAGADARSEGPETATPGHRAAGADGLGGHVARAPGGGAPPRCRDGEPRPASGPRRRGCARLQAVAPSKIPRWEVRR